MNKLAALWLCFFIPSTVCAIEVSNVSEAIKTGAVKGLLRYNAYYRDSNIQLLQDGESLSTVKGQAQQYSTLGGYLGYETAPLANTSVGTTFYTSNPIGNNPSERAGLGGLYEADGGQEAYTVLGEVFVRYQNDNHLLKLGRQEAPDLRFVSTSNIRMTPITHQALRYSNSSYDHLTFNLAYISHQKNRNAIHFEGMVRGARVETGCGQVDSLGSCVVSGKKRLIRGDYNSQDFDSSGLYIGPSKAMQMASVAYQGDSFKLELWDYYVEDMVNTAFLYGDYRIQPQDSNLIYTIAAQYANQKDVGSHVAGNVDTWYYGVKLQLNTSGLSVFAAYDEVEYNEDSYDGGTLFVRWGSPQMFNSFQVQDSELAGTKSYGVGLQYDFGQQGLLPGVIMRARFGEYDLPDDLNQIDARQDRSEATFDIRYSFEKASDFGFFTQLDGLSVLFRIAYNDFETDYDFAAYQSIHGYDFDNVTDNFMDVRFYMDYIF